MPTYAEFQAIYERLAEIYPPMSITRVFHVHDDSDLFIVHRGDYHVEKTCRGTRRYEAVKRLLKCAYEVQENHHHRITIYRFGETS